MQRNSVAVAVVVDNSVVDTSAVAVVAVVDTSAVDIVAVAEVVVVAHEATMSSVVAHVEFLVLCELLYSKGLDSVARKMLLRCAKSPRCYQGSCHVCR